MSVYELNNPHPKGLLTGDCVVKAVALAFDDDYIEVRKILNDYKRFLNMDSYKDNKFIYEYLDIYERLIIPVVRANQKCGQKSLLKHLEMEPLL